MRDRIKIKPLIVRDEIHGDMSFDPVVRYAIDHPCFQRLRHIKQLGLAEYVFPCANHTRFQHSLGASYLASQTLESLFNAWQTTPFLFDGTVEKTTFYAERTLECVKSVAQDSKSRMYWNRVVALAGLLHDVGHGPWSHTFEFLDLPQDFSASIHRLSGVTRDYFNKLLTEKKRLFHEDISVLYIFQILNGLQEEGIIDEAECFFLPTAGLVNKSIMAGELRPRFEAQLSESLKRNNIEGGLDFHRLLRPIISGPFDVDRMDYIQRDGRNCGVFISGIEWRRIVAKLIPCLAKHEGRANEPTDVVLISSIKNQHVLDDFIFTLFQMYAQVYLHPKIVGLEETIRTTLVERLKGAQSKVVTLDLHRSLTDEKFRELLKNEFKVTEIDRILARERGARFEVAHYPADPELEAELKKNNFRLIEQLDRPMMKDSLGLFLYSSYRTEKPRYFIRPWTSISPIAQHFFTIHYSPRIWIRPRT